MRLHCVHTDTVLYITLNIVLVHYVKLERQLVGTMHCGIDCTYCWR